MNNNNLKTTSFIIAFVGALLFSCKAIFIKMAYWYEIDKLSLLVLRMGFALPFYIFFAARKSKHISENKFGVADWTILITLGVIGYYFSSFLDIWGLVFISAGMERLILFVYPTITTILSAIVFKRRISWPTILAIFLTYSGISLAFWDKVEFGTNENFWFGALLIFGSAFTFSIYLVASERLIPKIGSMKFTSYSMIVSCIATLIHYTIANEINMLNYPWQVFVIALAISTLSTVLPSFMMSYAIKNIGASNTAITSSIGPIWVLVLAYFILDESFSSLQILGTLIVILGVWITSQSKK